MLDSGQSSSSPGAGAGVQPSSPRPCAIDRREFFHRRARIRSAREQMHDCAATHIQRHDRRDAACIRLPIAELEFDRRLKALRETRQHRRGSRVQSGRIRNHDCIRGDRLRSFRRAAFFRRAKLTLKSKSFPATTCPLARSQFVTPSPFVMTTCVSRLFACVAR